MDPTPAEGTPSSDATTALVEAVISDPAMADLFDPMVIVTLIGIALVNIALITSGKHALMVLDQGGVRIMDNPWFKAGLEFVQPVLGGVMGCIPGLLPLGICAGFLSPFIYRQVLSRYFPEAVVSHDSDKRAQHRLPEDTPTDPETPAP
jgi:hypothetical protein